MRYGVVIPVILFLACGAGAAVAVPAPPNRIDQAKAVLASLATGDPKAITDYVSKDKYIQHNLGVPSGRQALLEALPRFVKRAARISVLRAFASGDYVVLHTDTVMPGKEWAGFDVFRFENGKIVEHWDNHQVMTGQSVNGHTELDGDTKVVDRSRTKANIALVTGYVKEVLFAGQFAKVSSYLSAKNYTQHDPAIADGVQGLQQADPVRATRHYVGNGPFRVLGDGNFVLAMSHMTVNGKEAAGYDLWRVSSGKMVEHWEVIELTPPRAEWKNSNGKF